MTSQVTFICKRTVVSTKPVQPGKYHHPSVLDRLMEKNHLRIVYYYRSTRGVEAGEMTRKLRESLSEMLTSFPAVTGRLQKNDKGHWMIKCNDAGVRMVEARARGSVEEWLKNVDREKELKLIHWEDMFHKPYFWSTFYVQLTEFEGGGLAIGFSCIHLLADPICATTLIKAWADTTLAGTLHTPLFFHPLPPRRLGNKTPNHEPYTALINHYKSSIDQTLSTVPPLSTNNGKNATITLSFTDPMVRACMAMARTPGAPPHTSHDPSPFEALAGLFWVCLSQIKGLHGNQLLDMSICLDTRKVLGLDKGYFGNCMVYNKVLHAEFSDNKNKLSEAARAIRQVVKKMNENEGIMDLIEWLENNDHNSLPLMNGQDLICANLEGLDLYSAVFEEGFEPIRVSCYVEPVVGLGQVLVLPSPPGEGAMSRSVMVTLSEDDGIKLCEDDLVLQFCPTITMGMMINN
ncbi:hypothetical protein LWI28_006519 [Acer negundo]|uniref:Protein ECERIFERUM 26-like n=1 Tax=Acer negundo TaxID=4023 RepID=A0AAD5NZ60_ACENE|nr:hypothetical protein LWI28_006519 [Acer negundo]KAK4852919.1 hypothetical protein QYF36_001116 [Acer negundo]